MLASFRKHTLTEIFENLFGITHTLLVRTEHCLIPLGGKNLFSFSILFSSLLLYPVQMYTFPPSSPVTK